MLLLSENYHTFSLVTVDLVEALFLDFVVEVGLNSWLRSLLDGLCSIVFPLSMACSASMK